MKNMERRSFLEVAAAFFPLAALGQLPAPQTPARGIRVEHGADRFNEDRKIYGANPIAYKVVTRDTNGGLFILEQTTTRKGGPPRHLHHEQEEWFYVLEGEFIAEVGQERMRLKPGDSLLAPREVPHAWAYVGENPGRLLVAFQPAGKMESFFHEAAKVTSFARDEKLFHDHGMELLGPPLSLE